MKPFLLAASMLAASSMAHAQFWPPDEPVQTVNATAGRVTDARTKTGSPGTLSASATDTGAGLGHAYSSSAWASTRIGPGVLSGSASSRFAGTGSASTSLSAYQRDTLTFQRTDGGWDNELVVHYNIVIAGGTSGSISPITPPGGAGKTAGSLDWTLVHRLDDSYLTAWDSSTQLGYDGSLTTTSHWNSGEMGRIYGVYSFAAAILAGSATHLEFYMELSSTLNTLGLVTTGVLSADAPSIYWGGISQVTDWYGHRVNYQVSSASGFDYALSAAPISTAPEPASWALLLAGAALIGSLATRRSRTRASATHSATAGR